MEPFTVLQFMGRFIVPTACVKSPAYQSWAGNPYWRGRLITVDLHVQTSLYQLLLMFQKHALLFYRKSLLIEVINRTEPSPSISIPWSWVLVTKKKEGLWHWNQVVDRILGVPYQTCGEMMEEDPNMRSGFQYGQAYSHTHFSKPKIHTCGQAKS